MELLCGSLDRARQGSPRVVPLPSDEVSGPQSLQPCSAPCGSESGLHKAGQAAESGRQPSAQSLVRCKTALTQLIVWTAVSKSSYPLHVGGHRQQAQLAAERTEVYSLQQNRRACLVASLKHQGSVQGHTCMRSCMELCAGAPAQLMCQWARRRLSWSQTGQRSEALSRARAWRAAGDPDTAESAMCVPRIHSVCMHRPCMQFHATFACSGGGIMILTLEKS